MQGIKIELDQNSVSKTIADFKKTLDTLKLMSNEQKITFSFDDGVTKQLDAIIKKIDTLGEKAVQSGNKMKKTAENVKNATRYFEVSKPVNDQLSDGIFGKMDLDRKVAEIKRSMSTIKTIMIEENTEQNRLEKAVIQYTDTQGRTHTKIMGWMKEENEQGQATERFTELRAKNLENIFERQKKMADAVLKLRNDWYSQRNTEKNQIVGEMFEGGGDLGKTTSLLNKYKSDLDKIKKGFSGVDFFDKDDAQKLESTYNQILGTIENLTKGNKALTLVESEGIKTSLNGLKEESQELIKINDLLKQESDEQKQLLAYAIKKVETDRKAKVEKDTEEVLQVYSNQDAEKLAKAKARAEEQDKLYQQAVKSLTLQSNLERQLITSGEKKSKIIKEQLDAEELKNKKILEQLDLDKLILLQEKEITEQNKTDLKIGEELDRQIDARRKKDAQDKKTQDSKAMAEQSRVTGLGEKIDTPLNVRTDNEQIKEYIKTLHEGETQVLRYYNALDRNGNLVKVVDYKTRDGANGWKLYQMNLDKTTESTYLLDKGTREFQNRQLSLTQSIGLAVKKFVEYQVTTRLVYEAFNQLRNGFNFVNDLNKSLTEIGIVTYQSQFQMKEFGKTYNELAKEMRVTTGEIASASVEFYRQGLEQDEVIRRLQTTTKYAKISNLEFKESAEILTATVNSMGADINRVSDVFSYLGDATASGADEIGRSMQKVAGTSNALEVPLEKTTSWIALLSSKTREGSEVIGNSIKSLMLRYEQLKQKGFTEDDGTKVNAVAKALNEVGIKIIDNTGNFRNFGTVMDELGAKWDSLDNRHKAYISTQMAGIYQGSRFQNLMSSYGDSIKLYEGALESAGTTQSKYNIWLGGTEAHINQLKASSESLWLKVFDSKDIQSGIDMINGIVSGLDKMVSGFGAIPTVVGLAMGSIAMFKEKARIIDFKPSFTSDNKIDWKNTQTVFPPIMKNGFDGLKNAIDDVKLRYMYLNDEFKKGSNLTGNTVPTNLQKMSMGFKALTTSTIRQTVATGVLKLAMVGLNIAGGILIGVIANLVVNGIMKLTTASKQATEATATLLQNFKHNTQDNNNNIQTLSSMAEEYDKLSSVTNKTTEEQEKFNSFNNQIAQISPELVDGYDKQGNAMINLKNGIKGVVEALEEKNRLENAKLVTGGDTAFQSYLTTSREAQKKFDEFKKKKDELDSKGVGYSVAKDRTLVTEYTGSIQKLHDEFNALSEDQKNSDYGKKLASDINFVDKELTKNSADMQIYKSKIDETRNALMPFVQGLLNSNEAYIKLSSSSKKVVQDMVRLKDYSQYNTWDDINGAINQLVQNMNKPEVQNGVDNIGKLKDEFSKGTISATEFHDKAMAILLAIASQIDGMTPDKLAKLFDIDMSDNVQKVRTFGEVMEDVDDELQRGASDIENVNKALEKHANTNEWDMKTIVTLAKTYPELLSKLGDEHAMEEALIKIKQDRIGNAQNVYQTELNGLSAFVNSSANGYYTDVLNMKDASEAKLKIADEFARRIATMFAQVNASISSGMSEDDTELAWQRKISQAPKFPDIPRINTALDTYYAIKQFSSSFGSYAGGIGSSGYDGKSGGGSGGNSEQEKAMSEANSRLEGLRNHLSQAIRKKNEEDKNNALENLKKEEDARVNYYNGRIKTLQDEIDSLQDTSQDERDRLSKLKEELESWNKDDSIFADSKKKELQKQIDDLTKQLRVEELQGQIKTEQDNLKNEQDGFKTRQDEINKQYDDLLTDKAVYTQADALITSNAQQEILNLLLTFAPSYSETGSLLGKSMSEAMLDEIQKGVTAMNDLKSGNFGSSSSSSSGSSSSGGGEGSIAWDGKYYRYGATGETVKRIQKNLGITADGIWGQQTETAVRNFQRNNGLSVDGIIGKLTWSKLIKFQTGGVSTNEGLAYVHAKERILNANQTKIFDDFVYRLLPQISKSSGIDGFGKNVKNTFNAPVVQNDIIITNNTPFDVGNNMDNLNKAIKNELRTGGYKLGLI